MAKFVNYKKRGITLPPGCKDLIDVLMPHAQKQPHGSPTHFPKAGIVHWVPATGTLSDIGKFVALGFQSQDGDFSLNLHPPDDPVSVWVAWAKELGMTAFAIVSNDSLTPSVHAFFVRHGLAIPASTANVRVFWQITPLPHEEHALTLLLTDLFREVCGMEAKSELCFRYMAKEKQQ